MVKKKAKKASFHRGSKASVSKATSDEAAPKVWFWFSSSHSGKAPNFAALFPQSLQEHIQFFKQWWNLFFWAACYPLTYMVNWPSWQEPLLSNRVDTQWQTPWASIFKLNIMVSGCIGIYFLLFPLKNKVILDSPTISYPCAHGGVQWLLFGMCPSSCPTTAGQGAPWQTFIHSEDHCAWCGQQFVWGIGWCPFEAGSFLRKKKHRPAAVWGSWAGRSMAVLPRHGKLPWTVHLVELFQLLLERNCFWVCHRHRELSCLLMIWWCVAKV